MKKFILCLFAFFFSLNLSYAQTVTSDNAAPRSLGGGDDITALKQQVAQQGQTIQQLINYVQYLNRELGNIKQEMMLAKNIVVDIKDRPVKGKDNAQIVLLEFSDYQCPFCSRFSIQNTPVIDSLVTLGKIKKVFMDLPLVSIHPNAFNAAEAARCAGEQGKYWEMHDEMFKNQAALTPFEPHAEAIGLDAKKFGDCIAGNKFDAAINASMEFATSLNINSTPTIALALVQPDGSVVLNKIISGSSIKSEVDALAAKLPAAKPAPAPTPAPRTRRN